jgi:predicted nucleotidyltransferase
MRITKKEATTLKCAVQKHAPRAEVYLFGSRADDSKKGGDIDVLVVGERLLTAVEKRDVVHTFTDAFGEQKVDVVSFTHTDTVPFKYIALRTAVRL